MKKILKCSAWAIGALLGLVVLLAVLLYFPPFQNWAVKHVSAYASEKTGMDISVGHVRLEFPLNLGLDDVKVIKRREERGERREERGERRENNTSEVCDTVADIGHVVASVRLWPLLKKRVEIDELTFKQAKINTIDFIDAAHVKGEIGHLSVKSHGIDLGAESIRVDDAQLADAHIAVALADSVPPDTTEGGTKWKIAVDQLGIARSDVDLRMPGDTLRVKAHLGKAEARGGLFDLGEGIYEVMNLDVRDGRVAYDNGPSPTLLPPSSKNQQPSANNQQPPASALDPNHIVLSDVHLRLDSVRYADNRLDASLHQMAFTERSGIRVDSLSGGLALDSTRLYVRDFLLKTPESSMQADLRMDLNTFDAQNPGRLNTTLHASLGKQDLMKLMGDMPADFRRRWPNYPLTVDGVARGNMQRLSFEGLNVSLPTALKAKATGYAEHLDDMKRLKADVDLDAQGYDLSFARELLPSDLRRDVNIPRNIQLKANLKAHGNERYETRFVANEGGGELKGAVDFDAQQTAYTASLKAKRLALSHFMPSLALSPMTADIDLKGQGTDFTSPATRLTAKAKIDQLRYGDYNLDHISADADIKNGRARATLHSNNPLLQGDINAEALMSKQWLKGTVSGDITKADLFNLHLTDNAMTVSGCAHLDFDSNMKNYYKVNGTVGDLTIRDAEHLYRPGDVSLDLLATNDTTHMRADMGDFHLDIDAASGYEQLLKVGSGLYDEVTSQWRNRRIDQAAFRHRLPEARLSLTSGNDNFLMEMLGREGIALQSLDCHLRSSALTGLNGNMHIERLMVDSMLLDTVNVAVVSDSTHMSYRAQVRNNEKNPQYTFNALVDGVLRDRGTVLGIRLFDAKDKLGLRLGVEATMEENGFRFLPYVKTPIIGYKKFTFGDDNYMFLANDNRVSADVVMKADDGTGLQIYTNDDNEEALQDVTLTLHRLNIEEVLSVLPYMPDVKGILNGDFHAIQTPDELSVSSNLSVNNLIYENSPMGNLGTEFVYVPKDDGSHYVNGILMQNGEEIATLQGSYKSEGSGWLDAKLGLERMPLSLINGFIPDQIIGFQGRAEGDLDIRGTLSRPQVDGEVYLDSAYMVSVPYGVKLRFDNDPVRIVKSQLLLENFNMNASNNSPLTTYGTLDFSDLDHMRLDMKMRAQNFLLVDAKENPRSEAFGKAYVNFFGTMKGELSQLKMRGKLDVLGTTDLVYILRDSPLTTDNQLDELVKFTDFADTTQTVVNRPELSGFNMDLTVGVDKGAHVMAYLNNDKTNYIDLMGGGNLRMQYNAAENLRLTGRYSLDNGEMKYSLPIIPLKTFTIQDGSYIEFTGDPMNPTLNITATEDVRTTVTAANGVGRSVNFDCGVIITKTLNDMGLEFTLDAPEDMALHSELQTMSLEQRGKLAVTMLTTGMYLADGDTNGFSMNNALSTFLQSEINNITGNALRTLDFSVGLDNTIDASGNTSTNYSFKFAKRFWNNKLKIAVGGKVSTGVEMPNQNQSFFDNVTFEYRLDNTANKFVKLFYENNVYDWLEGYTQEYGGGFIWRRSLQHFKDIFNLKSDSKPTMPAVRNDSTLQKNETSR